MDVKKIISELRSEREQLEMEILSLESSGWLKDRTMASGLPATWTHKRDSEEQQDHDFCNLLQMLEHAVEQRDARMTLYCTCELKRLFRERAVTATRQLQSVAVAKHDN
jgi:hypothetical protein